MGDDNVEDSKICAGKQTVDSWEVEPHEHDNSRLYLILALHLLKLLLIILVESFHSFADVGQKGSEDALEMRHEFFVPLKDLLCEDSEEVNGLDILIVGQIFKEFSEHQVCFAFSFT